MTIVSNDPAWWSAINGYRLVSYFEVAAFVTVMYDWALTFGQEVELIWRQRWSLMTVLYLGARYLGLLYAAVNTLIDVPTISLTDTKILLFLTVTFLAVNTFDAVVAVMTTMYTSGEELILSGTYQCRIDYAEDTLFLYLLTWILATMWEVLALCLAVWIVVKHFHELRQHSAGGIIENCFMVLIKTHVVYFVSFVTVSCFYFILAFSPIFTDNLLDAEIISGYVQILEVVQMFVLGPRLILCIRAYYAKLVADSDAATVTTSIAFQERMHILTISGV
ncbi:uncharacterized protein HD556DRAFT_1463708 [Suillus plorans]|uniref:DUF6533 domain-containing protein n=1 Tax=Suillus plorans TaxID=116603 RepID=A0A9P7DLY5_9AGAM|nr:uncharacterized protein HD556DRAFT_1463708 [Suillus plorans]KAG1798152.1 hypothetical protein HD556DRAFT_1463708 [Suillus plorans]